jgi:hypothetical protein
MFAPIEEKESYRWLKSVETGDQVLKEAAHVTYVHDREDDIYEQFAGRGYLLSLTHVEHNSHLRELNRTLVMQL